MNAERAVKAFRREQTDRIPHWEAFNSPDAVELIGGIDPWAQPMSANLELVRRYALDVRVTHKNDESYFHCCAECGTR